MKWIRSLLDWMGWERLSETRQRHTELRQIMSNINDRLLAIEASLKEATTEIPNELAKLREQLGNVITPEADATITRLETWATGLANIIPGSPTETPAPAEETPA